VTVHVLLAVAAWLVASAALATVLALVAHGHRQRRRAARPHVVVLPNVPEDEPAAEANGLVLPPEAARVEGSGLHPATGALGGGALVVVRTQAGVEQLVCRQCQLTLTIEPADHARTVPRPEVVAFLDAHSHDGGEPERHIRL
jgi:hypothetical protein